LVSATLGLLLLASSGSSAELGAQISHELAAGWDFAPTKAFGSLDEYFGSSIALRGSLGPAASSRLSARFDADVLLFRLHARTLHTPGTCGPQGPCQGIFDDQSRAIVGLTADGVVNLTANGSLYAIGGLGVYDVIALGPSIHLGALFGGGLTFPHGRTSRFVFEATLHELAPRAGGPTWFAPLTLGLRF
jgi:hypothetical protein